MDDFFKKSESFRTLIGAIILMKKILSNILQLFTSKILGLEITHYDID